MSSNSWTQRTELLLGRENLNKLKQSHVLVVGLGGVGAYATEQLIRAGVGQLTIADGDAIHESNINRQLAATTKTVGLKKSNVLKQRYLEINPQLKLTVIDKYINDAEMEDFVLQSKYHFVIDAIDTLSPKIELIRSCIKHQIPIVSSMGSGAKTDPTKVIISDISKSYNDRLALAVRKRLRKLNIQKGLKVVFSTEVANKKAILVVENEKNKRSTTGTISYMPAIFGLYCASVAIREITDN